MEHGGLHISVYRKFVNMAGWPGLWMSVCAFRGGFTWAITLEITFTAPASTSFCMSGHKFCMSRHKFCMSGHKFLCLDTTFDTISGTTCHTTFCKKLCFDTTFMVSNTIFYVRTQFLTQFRAQLVTQLFANNYVPTQLLWSRTQVFMSGHNFLCRDTTFYVRTQPLTQI